MKQNYCKTLIFDNTWLILEFGYDCIYYLEGTERGLLIDTGIGGDDLKSFIDSFATKPYDLILTHGHLDHCGACCLFPEVFVNKRDWEMVRSTSNRARKAFIENLYEMSIEEVPDQSSDTMAEFDPDKLVLRDIDEGDVFDLGGRKVSAYAIPGHTDGCLCFYDDLSNIMFVGDAIIQRLLMVAGASDYTERLKNWKKDADRIFMSNLGSLRGIYMGHYGLAAKSDLKEIYHIAELLIEDISRLNEFDGKHYMIGKNQICLELPDGLDLADD